LAEQTVNVYGKHHPLTAGMMFDGVILGEKRRIWQWIMEPIFSLRGVF
jgi:membrane fusion protein